MFAMSTLVGTPVVAPVKAVRAVRSTRVNAAFGKTKPAKKTVAKAKAKVCFSPGVFLHLAIGFFSWTEGAAA